MNTLLIEPNLEKKTAKITGKVAVGELVSVTIDDVSSKNSSSLRLRVFCAGRVIAQYPAPGTTGSFTVSGDDLTCNMKFDSVEARKMCIGRETPVLLVMEDIGDNATLYFTQEWTLKGWPGIDTDEEPTDFSVYAFPTLVTQWKSELASAKSAYTSHASSTSNPHSVTKSQVGLGNVDNTSDANKPVSTATASAIASEKSQRERADSVLSGLVSTETENRIAADSVLSGNISDEVERAKGAEASIRSRIVTKVNEEKSRAQVAESTIASNLSAEAATARANEASISNSVDAEKARAVLRENAISAMVSAEAERAKGVENEIRQLAGGELKLLVVSYLPSTGVEKTIYLVPAASSKTGNVKDEYLWVNNAWEKIGSTEVDLSEYAKTEDLADVAMSGSYNDLSDKPTIPDVSGKIDTSKIVAPDYSVVSNGFVADAKKTYDGKADAGSNNCYDFTRSGVAFHIEGTRIWVTIGSITEEIKETAITIGGKTFSYEYGECMWNDPDYEEVPGYVNLIWPSSKDSAGRNACKCKYRKQIEYIYPTKSSAIAENITNNFKSALFSEVAKKVSGDSTKTDMQAAVDARVDAKKPTKTSELTNDSGFVTADAISGIVPTRVKNTGDTSRIDGEGNVYAVSKNTRGTPVATGYKAGAYTFDSFNSNVQTKWICGSSANWLTYNLSTGYLYNGNVQVLLDKNIDLSVDGTKLTKDGVIVGTAANPIIIQGSNYTQSIVFYPQGEYANEANNARLAREYPIKALTVTGGDATALDSTINTITPTATTTIAPPTAKTIGARDWIVVVTQGATAYGVTFNGSFVAESGFSWPTMEASKTYVFSFTEVSSNKFLAAVKEVATNV